ncbi:hypothetical protein ADUPG1_000045, partial [Aduncisulcus paluster]
HQKQRFLHDPMYSDTPLKKSSAFYTDVAEIASITEPLTIRCLKPTLIGSEGESSSRFKDIPEAHTLIPNETSQNYALHVCHGDKSPPIICNCSPVSIDNQDKSSIVAPNINQQPKIILSHPTSPNTPENFGDSHYYDDNIIQVNDLFSPTFDIPDNVAFSETFYQEAQEYIIPVFIPDPFLLRCVCDKLGELPQCAPTLNQLRNLYGDFQCISSRLSDLEGIQYLRNISSLSLNYHPFLAGISKINCSNLSSLSFKSFATVDLSILSENCQQILSFEPTSEDSSNIAHQNSSTPNMVSYDRHPEVLSLNESNFSPILSNIVDIKSDDDNEVVNIPDSTLNNCICSLFGFSDSNCSLTRGQMRSYTEPLSCRSKGIVNLEGIQYFDSITYLDLDQNTSLVDASLINCTNLEVLYLYSTAVDPTTLPTTCTKLTEIRVNSNTKIGQLGWGNILTMTSLTYIYASSCAISSIGDDLCYSLPNLKYLDLQANSNTLSGFETFQDCEALTHLYFSYIYNTIIDEVTTPFTSLPDTINWDILTNFACSYCRYVTDISVLANAINMIYLNLNYLIDVESIIPLNSMKSLRILYIYYWRSIKNWNELSGLYELTSIQAHYSNMNIFPDICDPEDPKLVTLYLYNSSGSYIDISNLGNCTSLTYLDLRHAKIYETPEPISRLFQLVSLYFSNVKIYTVIDETAVVEPISDGSFLAGLVSLTTFYSNDTAISDLTPFYVVDGHPIVDLRMNSNSITSVEPLMNLTNLQHLEMESNNISDISYIAGNPSLTYINFQNNSIQSISSISENQMINTMYLDNNLIEDINPLANTISSLITLTLNNNPLDISADNLVNLSNLVKIQRLEISGCGIINLPDMSGLVKLTDLNISNNPLSVDSEMSDLSTLSTLTILQTLYFRSIAEGKISVNMSFMDTLTKLTNLYLEGTKIDNMTPIAKCRTLVNLYINDTQPDYSPPLGIIPLHPLKKLQVLYGYSSLYNDISPLFTMSSALILLYIRYDRICVEDNATIYSYITGYGTTAPGVLPALSNRRGYLADQNYCKLPDGYAYAKPSLLKNEIGTYDLQTSTEYITGAACSWLALPEYDSETGELLQCHVLHDENLRTKVGELLVDIAADDENFTFTLGDTINVGELLVDIAADDENFTFTLGDTINVSHLRRLTGTSSEPLDLSNLGIESVRGLEYVSKASYINLSHNKISDVSPLLTLPSLTSLDLSYNSICFPLYYSSLADPSESDYVAALKAEFVEYTTGSASNLTISISDQSCDASCSGTSSMASGDHAVCHNSFGSTFTEECRIDHYLSSVSGTCIRDYLGVCFTCDKLNRQCLIDDSSSIYDPLQECGECRTWWYGVDCDQPCPFDPFDEDQFGEVESTGMCGVNHSITASHGVCLEDDHICQCETDYTGSACEYVKFDDENLEASLCRIVRDDPDAVCDGVAPFEMQPLNGILDLSNNDLSAGLKGLEFAINISGLDLSYNPLVDETDVLFISTFLIANESFDTLDLSGTGVSDILSTSFGDLFSTITSFAISDCSLTDVSQLTSFINLTSLGLSDVTQLDDQESGHSLTEDDIGSWLSSMESLATLDISNNNITSLRFLLEMSTQLEELNISGNNVSDLSPLYSFSMLQSLSVIDTRVVQGTTSTADIVAKFVGLEESVTLAEVNIETSYETPSACSYLNLVDAISLNMVCLETFPGSDTWYPVCASNSFAKYSDASTFSCTQTNDVDTGTNCIGGCAYGQECRQVVLSTVGSDLVSGECIDVVVDPALHSCVADMFPSSSPHVLTVYDSSSDSTSVLFSVASLKTLETVSSEPAGDPSPILSCSAQDVSDLSGIEHIGGITIIDVSYNFLGHNTSNLFLLSNLSNLVEINLSGTDINVINSLSHIPKSSLTTLKMDSLDVRADTDFSQFSDVTALSLRDNSSFTLSSSTSCYLSSFCLPSSLLSLDISGCSSFTDLSSLIPLSSSLISLGASNIGLTDSSLFDVSSLSSLQSLDLSNNSLTDISLLFQLSELTSLDVSQNKLCRVTDEIFTPFFTLSDIITITTSNESTSTAIDQDDAYCGYCSGSTPSVDPSSNVVCKEVWSGEYHTDCAIFSYRDYSNSGSGSGSGSGSEPLTCVNFGSEVDTSSLTCLSGIESNPNTQCMGVYNESNASVSIESGCVEGWYGDECLDECPFQGTEECVHYSNQQQCGGSEYGACDSSTHTCDCSLSGFHGDSCQYVTFADSHILSALCSLVDGHDSTCDDQSEGDLTESDLAGITLSAGECLDLSSLDITNFSGLEYLTNISCIDLSGNTSLSDISVLDSLSEFNHLTALNISDTAVDDLTQILSLSGVLTSLNVSNNPSISVSD